MYLLKNNLLPLTFGNLILRINQLHNHNTRSSNQSLFYVPFCRTLAKPILCSLSGLFLFQCVELRHWKCFFCFSIQVLFKKISTFTSLIPCFLSFFVVVVVVVCLCVVFIAPFPPSPLCNCSQNLISLMASIWASSPHFLYFIFFFTAYCCWQINKPKPTPKKSGF